MRMILGLALAAPLLLGTVGGASAQNYPWCAQYNLRGGATNCGFVSYAQCQATVSGIGGFCQPNPMYVPTQYGPRQPRKRHRVY
jgi:dipeptide/tripeptide permease